MSHTEAELWDLLDRAEGMPYGPGQLALLEQVIGQADALGLTRLAFLARMEATASSMQTGEPARGLVTFAWCLSEFDRDPVTNAHEYGELLWQFRYAIRALREFPEVALDQTYDVLDDMQRRCQETGHTMHAIYSFRHGVASHVGDDATAEYYYRLWCAEPRDDLSNCDGCDPAFKAAWLVSQGRDEEAVDLATSALAGRSTCRKQPQRTLTTVMASYVRTGRLEQARDAHQGAYRRLRPHIEDLDDIAAHIEFCARTGNEARGVEIMERHLGWLDRAPSPWAEMRFAASAALALRRAQARQGDLTVTRPRHGQESAGEVAAVELAATLADRATGIAARFDHRNRTDRVGRLVRATLDGAPWVEYLPLAPAGRAARPTASAEEVFRKRAEPEPR